MMNMDKLDCVFEEFKKEVKSFSQNSNNRENLYDYESGFRDLVQKYEHEIFQSSIGEVPQSKNKKKR
jgi:hypothetical protein